MYAVHMARGKTAKAYSDPKRVQLLKIIEDKGLVTQGQLAKLTGLSWGRLQWHLYVLEREGLIKRVVKDGLVYYAPAHLTIELFSAQE